MTKCGQSALAGYSSSVESAVTRLMPDRAIGTYRLIKCSANPTTINVTSRPTYPIRVRNSSRGGADSILAFDHLDDFRDPGRSSRSHDSGALRAVDIN